MNGYRLARSILAKIRNCTAKITGQFCRRRRDLIASPVN
ncbi:hypothetical protein CDAR_576951, partial [Caerostris darwini]